MRVSLHAPRDPHAHVCGQARVASGSDSLNVSRALRIMLEARALLGLPPRTHTPTPMPAVALRGEHGEHGSDTARSVASAQTASRAPAPRDMPQRRAEAAREEASAVTGALAGPDVGELAALEAQMQRVLDVTFGPELRHRQAVGRARAARAQRAEIARRCACIVKTLSLPSEDSLKPTAAEVLGWRARCNGGGSIAPSPASQSPGVPVAVGWRTRRTVLPPPVYSCFVFVFVQARPAKHTVLASLKPF